MYVSTIQTIPITSILLDTKNPRHVPIEEQSEIIDYFVKNGKLRQLAKDIVEQGVSPIDLLALIKHKSTHYIALEGNRRLCALILLNDNKLCPQNERKFFNELTNGKTVPNSINAVVFDSRKEADVWIERRHSGEQNGIGTLQWDAAQKTRWNKSREKKDPNALALAVLDYAKQIEIISEEEASTSLTTATRYLSNPYFRNTIGIATKSNDPDPELNVDVAEFNRVLKKFCEDLVDNKSEVTSRSSKTGWENYARKLVQENIAPQTKCARWKLGDGLEISGEDNELVDDEKPKSRPSPDPDKRKNLVPRGSITIVSNDKFLKRALIELNSLEVDRYPLGSAMVCRAFLERIYRTYHQEKIGVPSKKKAHEIMSAVIREIENKDTLDSKERAAFESLKSVNSNVEKVFSPKSLGANAHLARIPTATDLKRDWDNIESIVQYMLNQI